MIRYIKGDLFQVTTGVIAHGCNCIGVMGAGVAKTVRELYPEVFKRYSKVCANHSAEDLLGLVQIISISPTFFIANCFTQTTIARNPVIKSKLADANAIKESLTYVAEFCQVNKLQTVSMPKIGAGLGGLDWESEVEPVLHEISLKFSDINFDVYYI